MTYINILIYYFIFFALIHSLLAADFFKCKVKIILGPSFRFYRIIYNIISFLTFFPVIFLWIKNTVSSPLIYSIPELLVPVFFLFRLAGIGLFIYAAIQTDLLEFIGLRQVRKAEKNMLITKGAYGLVRHPIYTGGIVVLFTKIDMNQIDLTAIVLISLYLIIGAYIEEKRLIRIFDPEYRVYQQQVSMFIPIKYVMKLLSHRNNFI